MNATEESIQAMDTVRNIRQTAPVLGIPPSAYVKAEHAMKRLTSENSIASLLNNLIMTCTL